MELINLYPAAVNSRATVTLGVLNEESVTIEVLDATVLPDAPNLLVLGTDQTAETVLMTAKEGNTLTVERAVQGNAIRWPAGTQIARNFTAKDWNDLLENIDKIAAHKHTALEIGALPADEKVSVQQGGLYINSETTKEDKIEAQEGIRKLGAFSTVQTTNPLPTIAHDTPSFWRNHLGAGNYFFNDGESFGMPQQYFFVVSFSGKDTTETIQIGFGANGAIFYTRYGSGDTWYSDWVERADASKFLPLDGSVPMSGSLNVTVDTTGVGSYSGDNACAYIECFKGDWENRRQIVLYNPQHLSDIKNAFNISEINSGISKYYNIFGEHNKPSGSYTGNGSSTTRTINIGGVGNILYISSPYGFGFVTADGGFFVQASYDTTAYVVSYSSSYIKFVDGVLTIESSSSYINSSSYTYTYRVL